MNPTSARLAKFFRALADACEKLTEDELEYAISEFQSFIKALKSGEPHPIFGGLTHRRGTLDYLPGPQAPRKSVRGRSTKIAKSRISPATVLDQLNRANSRKEGEKILQNLKLRHECAGGTRVPIRATMPRPFSQARHCEGYYRPG